MNIRELNEELVKNLKETDSVLAKCLFNMQEKAKENGFDFIFKQTYECNYKALWHSPYFDIDIKCSPNNVYSFEVKGLFVAHTVKSLTETLDKLCKARDILKMLDEV